MGLINSLTHSSKRIPSKYFGLDKYKTTLINGFIRIQIEYKMSLLIPSEVKEIILQYWGDWILYEKGNTIYVRGLDSVDNSWNEARVVYVKQQNEKLDASKHRFPVHHHGNGIKTEDIQTSQLALYIVKDNSQREWVTIESMKRWGEWVDHDTLDLVLVS